jgi:hypothetical protein
LSGNQPENLLIGFAAADGAWTVVKPTVDVTGNRTCATTNQIAQWGSLFSPQNVTALLPATGQQEVQLWLIPLFVGGLLILGAWRLALKYK